MDLDVVFVGMTLAVDVNVLVTMMSCGVSRRSPFPPLLSGGRVFISTLSLIEIGHLLHALVGRLSPQT